MSQMLFYWPQVVIAILIALGAHNSIQKQDSWSNVMSAIAATVLLLWILYCGGFYS